MSDTAQNHLSAKMQSMFAPTQQSDDTSQLLQALPSDDDQVIADVQSVAPAIPLAVDQATDTLNPPYATTPTVKEVAEPSFTIEKPMIDQLPGVQYVEAEPHELPPEVESFITKVEEHQEQIPAEIVMTDQNLTPQPSHYLAKPVIVLPITSKIEKTGKGKSSTFSVRWLVEFSQKMMKMFHGGTVYRESESA